MPEETEFTFAHFVDSEALSARVRDLGEKYSDEEVAATCFYLGVLSVTAFSQVMPLYGDSHYVMHLLSNIFAGEWLTTLVETGVINPEKTYDLVLREHGDFLNVRPNDMEDIKSEKGEPDGIEPMDRSTFHRLWGGHVA